MTPSDKGKGDWYKKNCEVIETVWRSSRLNEGGDELVVAKGIQDGKTGYFMAWEVKENSSAEEREENWMLVCKLYYWVLKFLSHRNSPLVCI